MANLVALTAANQALWNIAKILPSRLIEVDSVAKRLCAVEAKARYQEIEKTTRTRKLCGFLLLIGA